MSKSGGFRELYDWAHDHQDPGHDERLDEAMEECNVDAVEELIEAARSIIESKSMMIHTRLDDVQIMIRKRERVEAALAGLESPEKGAGE